jgi:hypothetical protein
MPSFSIAESEITIDESDIEVQMWPEIPEPYKNVDIKLISYATDLNKANIEWKIGSGVVLSGYGKINYSFTTPGDGSITNITISIIPTNSLTKVIKQIVIKPAEIEVFWEAVDGYTPLFYKGKSFVSSEGYIKAVAIPNSSTIKYGKGNISYKWSKDDTTVQSASGYNKDSYVFENSSLKTSESISLSASSIDGSYNAVKNLEIPIYSPKVIFYKKSPTEGIMYNAALSSNSVFSEEEMTIVAEPYFLAIKDNEDFYNYKWKINGETIDTPLKKKELTVRPTSRGGYANISVTFENMSKLFQKVTGALKLSL